MKNKTYKLGPKDMDTLRYISIDAIGLFYDSYTKTRHWCRYVPYGTPPRDTLCEKTCINKTATKTMENVCTECQTILDGILK